MAVIIGPSNITGASTIGSGVTAYSISNDGTIVRQLQRPMINGGLIKGSGGSYSSAGIADTFALNQSTNLSWTSGTQRFTVTVAGVYLMSWSGLDMPGTGRTDANIYVNGGNITNSLSEDNRNGYHYRCLSIAYFLNVNDYVQIYKNGSYYYSGNWGWFNMVLIA
jgi:hypothetical protein